MLTDEGEVRSFMVEELEVVTAKPALGLRQITGISKRSSGEPVELRQLPRRLSREIGRRLQALQVEDIPASQLSRGGAAESPPVSSDNRYDVAGW
jgi:hypothetical protein